MTTLSTPSQATSPAPTGRTTFRTLAQATDRSFLVHGIADLLKSDQFFFPVVVRARTYAWAALCVVAAGAASALVVRRRIDRLDMVSALKTRD